MATQTEKFTGEEAFVRDLFTHKHMGKSWVGFVTKDSIYKISVFPGNGRADKVITIEKKDCRLFEVEIQVGPCSMVAAKITWQTDLPGLLMRLEPELSPDYTV